MAIISGVTVNWVVSPRIITIPDTVNEVTIFDLQDTLLDLEDSEEGIIWPYLRELSGGEALGGGVTVGYTMELQNAQVQFEGRTTALTNGTNAQADTSGTVLVDSGATFQTAGVARGNTVFNSLTGAMAAIISVDSQTQITHQVLSGGSRADWQTGDDWVIYNNEQCNITGGNLVAVDGVGSSISPVFQSPNTNVIRSSASSATNQNLATIEYGSYNNEVTIDAIDGDTSANYTVAGVTNPGSTQYPVNNLADAITLAEANGFRNIRIRGNLTIGSQDWSDGYTFWGEDHTNTTVTVQDPANINNCSFRYMTLMGVMDNSNHVNDCMVMNLTSFDGMFHDCGFMGTVTLGGSQQTTLESCYSMVAGGSTPTVNMGGSGSALAVRGYMGGLKLTNRTGTDACSLDITSGQVVVDSTCTAGDIYIRGVGKLTDNSTGTCNVIADDYLQAGIVMDGITRATYSGKNGNGPTIDAVGGTDSAVYPVGTPSSPCKTLQNLEDIDAQFWFKNVYVENALTIDRDYSVDSHNWIGANPQTTPITLDALSDISNNQFFDAYVVGKSGTNSIFRECIVGNLTNVSGFIYNSTIEGTLTFAGNTSIEGCWIAPSAASQTTVFDFNSVACTVIVSDWSAGRIECRNMVTGSFLGVTGTGGRCVISATNTAGIVVVGGAIEPDITNKPAGVTFSDATIVGQAGALTTEEFIALN